MKKYLFLIIGILLITVQEAYCATEAVSPELGQSLKSHANEPSIFSIIFALGFVIFLIYITGVIYSKLNIVGAKTVKEQLRNSELNRAIVLSTTQLGQGKNLHVIEINDKKYLIGATQNSINLIKELVSDIGSEKIEPPKKIYEKEIDKAIEVLYSDNIDEIIKAERKQEEFNVHKKYL